MLRSLAFTVPLTLTLAAVARADDAPAPPPPIETKVEAPPGSGGLTVVAPTDGGGGIAAVGCSAVVVTNHATDVKPSPDAVPPPCGDPVLVHFRAANANESTWWTVRRGDGGFVCAVPCTAWVPPKAHLTVQRENAAFPEVYVVPDDLPVEGGGEMDVVVDRMRALGSVGKLLSLPLVITFGLGGIAMVGFGIGDAVDPHGHTSTTTASTSVGATSYTRKDTGNGEPAVTIGVGAGMLAVAALSTYWFVRAHDGGLTLEPPTHAGGAGGTASTGARFRPTFGLTRAGVGGTF